VAAFRDPEDAAKAAAWAAKQPTLTSAVLECVSDPAAGSVVRLRFARVVNDRLGLDDPLLTESESVARSWAFYAAGVRGPVKFDD
jgi:hypothetical protein